MERQKICSRLKGTHDCYARKWPCSGKYILEYIELKGSYVHNLLSNGSEKY